MSTSKNSSSLEVALAGVDASFRSRLIGAYIGLKDAVRDGRHDLAGLNTGKLCEVCLRFLQQEITGSHIAFDKPIPNFADECRNLITAKASTHVPESLRVVVPRALVFAYTMRNKRGIGHVGGDVDANKIDVATMTRITDWIVCELIRVYHDLSLEQAQELVDGLAARETVDIWEVGGKKRVLRSDLTLKQRTLLLLHADPTTAVREEDLCSWIECERAAVYRRDVLRPLHAARLVEFDETAALIHISPLSIKEVEERIRTRSVA